MSEWTFNFWQMLSMLFLSYYCGMIIAMVRARMQDDESNVGSTVKIDVTKEGEMFYAFEEETKKFLAQSPTYEDLQKALSALDPNVTYITEEDKLKVLLGTTKNATII